MYKITFQKQKEKKMEPQKQEDYEDFLLSIPLLIPGALCQRCDMFLLHICFFNLGDFLYRSLVPPHSATGSSICGMALKEREYSWKF